MGARRLLCSTCSVHSVDSSAGPGSPPDALWRDGRCGSRTGRRARISRRGPTDWQTRRSGTLLSGHMGFGRAQTSSDRLRRAETVYAYALARRLIPSISHQSAKAVGLAVLVLFILFFFFLLSLSLSFFFFFLVSLLSTAPQSRVYFRTHTRCFRGRVPTL
ncbi:hypothetical protein L209DRAFT_232046 [Thermothelomyces heterothallicus CBS 203.75]